MLDSDFWRDLAEEFRALDPTGKILSAHWIYNIDDNDLPCSEISWALTQTDGHSSVQASFMPKASRAAIRLFPLHPTARISVDLWLDAIKRYRKAQISTDGVGMSMGKGTRWGRGAIDDICVASADFCHELEAMALDIERTTPQTQKEPAPEHADRPPQTGPSLDEVRSDTFVNTTSAKRTRRSSMMESHVAVERINAHLIEAKNRKGVSITDFYSSAHVDGKTFRSLLKTGRAMPDIFRAIAKAMGISFEELIK